MPYIKKVWDMRGKTGINRLRKGTYTIIPPKYFKKKKKPKLTKKLKKSIKAIAKRECDKKFEMNYAATVPFFKQPIAHTSAVNNGALTDPRPRCQLITDYVRTFKLDKNEVPDHAPTATNGDEDYQEKQKLYLQNIQLKLEVVSPYGETAYSRSSSNWCRMHWAILRTTTNPHENIPNLEKLFKGSWFAQTAAFNKDNKRNGISIVKRGSFDCSPNKQTQSSQNVKPLRVVKRQFNIPIKKTITLLREHAGSNTNALPIGNLNSANYWVALWIEQEFQNIGPNYMYNNYHEFSNEAARETENGIINCGPVVNYYCTLSGYGMGSNT